MIQRSYKCRPSSFPEGPCKFMSASTTAGEWRQQGEGFQPYIRSGVKAIGERNGTQTFNLSTDQVFKTVSNQSRNTRKASNWPNWGLQNTMYLYITAVTFYLQIKRHLLLTKWEQCAFNCSISQVLLSSHLLREETPSSTQRQCVTTLLSGYRLDWKRGRTAANVGVKMGDYREMDQRWHDAWSVHIEKLLQRWRCHCGGTFHTCQRRMILPIISSERETRHYHVRKGVPLREKIRANTTGLLPPLCRRDTFNNQMITA